MVDDAVIATIDDLHALEGTSLLERVAESAAYVPMTDAQDASAVDEMVADEKRHLHWLADLLDELDATPGPRRVVTTSADLHFNRLETLLPRVIADKKRIIHEYEAALKVVAGQPRAADVVSKILARHRDHLARLTSLHQAVTF